MLTIDGLVEKSYRRRLLGEPGWQERLVEFANAGDEDAARCARAFAADFLGGSVPEGRRLMRLRDAAREWLEAVAAWNPKKPNEGLVDELEEVLRTVTVRGRVTLRSRPTAAWLRSVFKDAKMSKQRWRRWAIDMSPASESGVDFDVSVSPEGLGSDLWPLVPLAVAMLFERDDWRGVRRCKRCGRLFFHHLEGRRRGRLPNYCAGHAPTGAERVARHRKKKKKEEV